MPSNKEIAGWLRECAKRAEAVVTFNSNGDVECFQTASSVRAEWLARAEMVENMRCEMCKWWDKHSVNSRLAYCTNRKSMWECDDCCCQWEGRE
jgi:hypothetical protein